jgi:hypothetical protein
MRNFWIVLGLAVALAGCTEKNRFDIPTGTDVTVEKTDGVTVAGRLVEVQPEQVVVESRDGVKTRVPRAQIASMRARLAAGAGDEQKSAPPAPAAPPAPNAPRPDDKATAGTADARPAEADATAARAAAPVADAEPSQPDAKKEAAGSAASTPPHREPEYRELTLPAGTTLSVELASAVASDTSQVEDPVRGRLRAAIRVDGFQALPVGTAVVGHVTSAQPSAKVKGRASVAFRFDEIDLPGQGAREPISTATWSRVAPATRKKDATKVGIGAGAGAVIGGILGGGSGAAKGAAIGGGAGAGMVLSTRGDEVRIPAGTPVTIKLTAPLTVRVLVK